MCKVYNPVGSLTTVKNHLITNNINDLKSIKELIDFQSKFPVLRLEIVAKHREIIEEEKNNLSKEIPHLDKLINDKQNELERLLSNKICELQIKIDSLIFNNLKLFSWVTRYPKRLVYQLKLIFVKHNLQKKITYSLAPLINDYDFKENRLKYIETKFDDAVNESCYHQLSELVRKKNILDQINSYIYGAIGEQKVVKEIEKLSDQYFLINDFTLRFHPAIYRKQTNDYIKSIQIDHILLSPSGIFLIETKNWSQESMDNLNLHSPVQQIRRTNYVLYRLINEYISSSKLRINRHHWGDRKIPIRNLIVLIKHKPVEDFQHVKVLTLNEMLSYITYFEHCLSTDEVQAIANKLTSINNTSVYNGVST